MLHRNNKTATKFLVIGGSPRSGSTYLQYLINQQYITEKVSISKTHMEKDHLTQITDTNYNETWVVPVRDPHDTAISTLVWYYHNDSKKSIDHNYNTTASAYGVLDSLTRLWETILLDKQKFVLIDFDVLISDREKLEFILDTEISWLSSLKRDSNVSDSKIKEILSSEDKQTYKHSLEVRSDDDYANLGHLPREKSKLFLEVTESFKADRYSRRFEYLDALKSELLNDRI